MNTQFIKFLRTLGVVTMLVATIFLLHGAYHHSVFDGLDVWAMALIVAGASTFFLRGKDDSLYIRDFRKYW